MSELLTDLTVELLFETDKAYLVSDGDKEVWLPKLLCEVFVVKDSMVEVTLPEWLAKREGLI